MFQIVEKFMIHFFHVVVPFILQNTMPVCRYFEIMIIALLLTTLNNHNFCNGRLKINIAYETSDVLMSWKQVGLFEPIFCTMLLQMRSML
jgi:hypothetical protein